MTRNEFLQRIVAQWSIAPGGGIEDETDEDKDLEAALRVANRIADILGKSVPFDAEPGDTQALRKAFAALAGEQGRLANKVAELELRTRPPGHRG